MKIPTLKDAQRTAPTLVTKEQSKMLTDRLRDEGYMSVAEFGRRTGLFDRTSSEPDVIAEETVNRAMREGARNPAPITIAMIMMVLRFTREEIEQRMEEMGDRFVGRFIRAAQKLQDRDLTMDEAALLDAYRKLDAPDMVAAQIEVLAKMKGVDISPELAQMGAKMPGARRRI